MIVRPEIVNFFYNKVLQWSSGYSCSFLRVSVVMNDVDVCQAWVSENVTNDFQDGFIIDVEPNQKEGFVYHIKFKIWK